MSNREEIEEKIAAWKRDVLSDYCINQCQESCCYLSNGALITDEAGLKAVKGVSADKELDPETLKIHLDPIRESKVGLPLYMHRINPCEQLDTDTKKCKIYDHPDRPEVCKLYPVSYIRMNHRRRRVIFVDRSCEAIRETIEGNLDDSVLKIGKEYGVKTVFSR